MEDIEEIKIRAELYKDEWITQRDWRSGKLLDDYIKVEKAEIQPYIVSPNVISKRVVVFGKKITVDKEYNSLKYTRNGIMKFTGGFEDVTATEEQAKQFEELVNTCESFLR